MEGITGRTAIVTGGTRGLGLAISRALVAAGARVAAVYRSDEDAARAALAELSAEGGEAGIFRADVGSRAEVDRVVAEVLNRWKGVDLLINNAGVFDFGFLDEMTDDFIDTMIATNLKGTIFMMQACVPHMKQQRFGRIVNASSISGHFADAGLIAYASAKAGVDMTTRIGAVELAPYGITVNAFAPGIIRTDMTRAMIEERGHLQVRQIPTGRFGDPEDVASLVLFLCSKGAAYITGEVIGVDGGMMKVQNPYRAVERAEGAT